MSKNKILLFLISILLVSSMLLTSCQPKAAAPTQEPEKPAEVVATEAPAAPAAEVKPIKIGGLYPLTGTDAINGQNYKIALDYAVKEINAAGGVKCMGGAPFELVYADTQGKSEVGNTETERLITEAGVIAITGSFHSHVMLPASEITERYEVPMFASSAIAGQITKRGLKYIFMTITSLEQWALDGAKFAAANGAKTGVIATMNIAFGEETKVAWEAALKEVGIEQLDSIVYQFGASDLSADILKVKSLDPDVLFLLVNTADAILWVNQMQDLQYYPKMGIVNLGGGFVDPTFLSTVGNKSAEGIILTSDWFANINLPGAKEANQKFKDAVGINLSGLNGTVATLYLIRDALEISCSYDPKALAEVMRTHTFEKGDWNFQWDKVKFDSTGAIEGGMSIIAQYQNGEQMTVWPENLAVVKVIWPVPGWDAR